MYLASTLQKTLLPKLTRASGFSKNGACTPDWSSTGPHTSQTLHMRSTLSSMSMSSEQPRRPTAWLFALVVALIVACSYSVTETRSVEIPGDAPVQQKIALAKRVATSLWRSGLHEKIRSHVPGVTEAQLRGLDIRWQKLSGVRVGEGTGPIDKFFLECTITLPQAMKSTGMILDYCKQLLEEELASIERGEATQAGSRVDPTSTNL